MKDAVELTKHPLAKPHIKTIQTTLNGSWERKERATLPPTASEWMHWILLEQEQRMKDRYVNLNLTLQSASESNRGLFHEWQIRPIKKNLNDSDTWQTFRQRRRTIVYFCLAPYQYSLDSRVGTDLHIDRRLFTDDGTPLHPLDCEQGQSVHIQTRVQTTPNTPFCIREWSASGLSHNHTPESHFCTISDADGLWIETTSTHVVFEGRFRLPSTMAATETELAHTETIWFETRQYKEFMSE